MLVPTVLLFTAVCALIVTGAVLSSHSKRRLASAAADVRGEVDRKVRQAEQVDETLAKGLAGGKPAQSSIAQWQASRADILSVGKTARPWSWTADDLQDWAKERVAAASAEVRRVYGLWFVIACVAIVGVAVLSSLGYYHAFAKSRISPSRSVVEGFTDSFTTSASADDPTYSEGEFVSAPGNSPQP